jgi:hypothetical protein
MGEAAGTAAHLALAGNTRTPAEISVDELQRVLEQNGTYLGRDVA